DRSKDRVGSRGGRPGRKSGWVLLDPHLGRFLGITKGKWVAEETHRCGETPVVVLADEAEAKVLQEELVPDSVVALDASPDALIKAVSSLLPV
ncbi:TPA: hypothetical protein DCE37_19240, partial [Candidatus Latescibacteria bacterium]|nr:hypothetical protein [Candidatus Latescibacterota bacterium]